MQPCQGQSTTSEARLCLPHCAEPQNSNRSRVVGSLLAMHCLTWVPHPLRAAACLQMSGTLKVDGSGNVELQEEDGIDYAAVTVQLPGGERVPFLFTVKNLQAKGSLDAFGGEFTVPSYRGATFLDPKVGLGQGHTCWGCAGVLHQVAVVGGGSRSSKDLSVVVLGAGC